MKKLIITTIVLAFVLLCQAQSIEYGYDNAGNRVSRRIIDMGGPQNAKKSNAGVEDDSEAIAEQAEEEIITDRNVKIYPNPTKGILGIELYGEYTEEQSVLTLYNGQGALLVTQKVSEGRNVLDLSAYPAGWYILRVGGKEYKIIKQ
jgi:hypothetical protein